MKKSGSPLEEIFLKQCTELGIPPNAREFTAIPKRRFKWDFGWTDAGVLVEIQGGVFMPGKSGHTFGPGVRRDTIKNNLAVLYGYRPFQFTSDFVRSGKAARFIQEVLKDDISNAAYQLRDAPKRKAKGRRPKVEKRIG